MKTLIVTILSLVINLGSFSQTPVSWNYTSKKIADKTYEVHIKATVQNPWHIYSQTTPDGGPLATKFTFSKNPLLIISGKPKEVGKLLQKHEEVFGVDVKYFDGSVDFVQVVKVKSSVSASGRSTSFNKGGQPALKTNVSGTLEFMVCNDEQCLPPKTIRFSVAVGE